MQNGGLENSSNSPPQQSDQTGASESVADPAHITDHAAPQDYHDGPPTKKRKLADTAPAPKNLPRPVSPPWKRIAAEGPTSFVEDGRRKSSRTNAVPLELQPPSAARRTRAATHKVEESKSKTMRHSYGGSAKQNQHEKAVYRKTVSAVKPAQSGPGTPSGWREPLRSPSAARCTHPKVDASPSPKSRNTVINHSLDTKDDILPQHQLSMKNRISPERARYRPHTPRGGQPESSDASPRQNDRPSPKQKSEPYTPATAEALPKPRLQKIRFTVRMPPVVVQCPANIPQRKCYNSFHDFLENDELEPKAGEDVLTAQQVQKEARTRKKVRFAQRSDRNLDKELEQVLPERQQEPDRQYFHYDHLVAHSLHFKKLLQHEHQKHKANAKRIAHEAAKRVRASKPKSADEVEQEQKEAGHTRYLQVIKDLSRFWALVGDEVDAIRQSEIDAIEQAQKMREFNEQVEKHTQMLAPQLHADSGEPTDEDDESDSAELPNEGSEDNMSDSESESEADLNTDDADATLTAEQLHDKYANLPAEPTFSVDHDEDVPDAPDLLEPNLDVEESVVLEQVDDALLDDDGESIDTDDGEDSDSVESDRDASGEESDHDEEGSPTLRSLFGPREFDDTTSIAPASTVAQPEDFDQDQAKDTPFTGDHESVVAAAGTQQDQRSLAFTPKPITDLVQPAAEDFVQDHNSVGISTPASLQTSVTKASEGDSFTSSDVRADSQRPVTPLRTKESHIKTPVPSLLRGTLREYQHEGLEWLANLYVNRRNGILADEMGLGKTIQSIALLAHLAVEHHVWGPHLIIVPSSVMLNWEMEFKKFCPGFKVLTYYGHLNERKQKRRGWMDNDLYHVVITSYQLVVQDYKNFRRRNWHYMILDEAHNIKNFRSQRWQTLLTFKTRARLLLTGTPLQNSLTELWSLLFFLRPTDMAEDEDEAFAGLSDFSDWFRKPVDQILDQGRDTMDDEARDQVAKLHKVIRPYLLRRLKADVEKQMPAKYEHIELCRLSKRQRQLYDGFMSRTKTKETLASGNYLSIINCLMQLRKVCNHPDLFETRAVTTSFAMSKPVVAEYEVNDFLVRRKLLSQMDDTASLDFLRLAPISREDRSALEAMESTRLMAFSELEALRVNQQQRLGLVQTRPRSSISGALASLENIGRRVRMDELEHTLYQEYFHHREMPVYGSGLISRLSVATTYKAFSRQTEPGTLPQFWDHGVTCAKLDLVQSVQSRANAMQPLIQRFGCATPAVVASDLASKFLSERGTAAVRRDCDLRGADPFHEARTRLSIAFPDKRLLQYDCGKLQRLDKLLRELQAGGHRALIFTQMTKVLDILEQFLNIHGHRYLRLDGATKIEQRQILTERFNSDPQFLAFILSSRSGGLGINLTGADTVIFYDLDWNPAMDKQCQDRCHRIGQTRDVHIYRFVSEHTIESNILRKSNQKRMLDDVVIQEGDFTTDYFNKLSMRVMLGDEHGGMDDGADAALDKVFGSAQGGLGAVLETAEDQEDAVAAQIIEREERHADDGDFDDKAASHEASATPRTPGAQTPREAGVVDPSEGGFERPPFLKRPMRSIDDWVLDAMMRWKNEDLGEIKAETLASATRHRKLKKKKRGEHRIKKAK